MAELIALTPCADLLPLTEADVSLIEVLHGKLQSVAPFAGKAAAVSAAMLDQIGAGLPAPNRREGPVTWAGHNLYLVLGPLSLDGLAAVTDQSDAWAHVALSGAAAEAVLARLVPVDLRLSVFAKNCVARTMLGHLAVSIVRTGPQTFEIAVMRSMAATLVHDLHAAMRGVAARG